MWGVYRRSVVAVVVVLGVVNVRIRLLASRRGMRSRQSMGLTQIGRACPSPSAQMPSRERIVKGRRQLNSGGACGGVARRCWKRQNDSLRNVWDSLAAEARCRSADTMRRSSGRRQNAVPSPWDACLWAVNGSCFGGVPFWSGGERTAPISACSTQYVNIRALSGQASFRQTPCVSCQPPNQ